MISKKTLKELIVQKQKDANILLTNKRYSAAIYIAGYALELTLKLKICKLFKFTQGFPENNAEFSIYQNSVRQQTLMVNILRQIRDIKNHDLNKLLIYSGNEYTIKTSFFNEWNIIATWNPDMRYKLQKILKKEAVANVNAINKLIENIL